MELRHWLGSVVFIVDLEQISQRFLVFLLFTFSMYVFAGISSL